MENSNQLSARFGEVMLNGTWIANTNFKHVLDDVNWQQAVKKTGSLNTIAALTFHINYYITGIIEVLKGGELTIRDKYSFDMPEIKNEEDWNRLKESLLTNSAAFAQLVAGLTDEQLAADFSNPKYGSYRRNIEAMIEHAYYHLGQLSLLKKMNSL